MGFLSPSGSVTRYKVKGELAAPVLETAARALAKHAIEEEPSVPEKKVVGWTSFANPYEADFSGSSFAFDPYLLFAMRVDKKTLPAKLVKKEVARFTARRLAAGDREFLSREQKKEVRAEAEDYLLARIPAVPHVFDVLWNYEAGDLWLFSTQKAACEDLQTLFYATFGLVAVPMVPFTKAEACGLSPAEVDALSKAAPASFAE